MSLKQPVELIRVQRQSGSFCQVAMAEMQGLRDAHEDAHFFMQNGSNGWAHFGVLDGHGGSKSARLASSHLPSALNTACEAQLQGDEVSDMLKQVFVDTDRWLWEQMSEGMQPSGSTCVTSSVRQCGADKFECFLANAGDSRGLFWKRSETAVHAETNPHRPDQEVEAARITAAGGSVMQIGMCHRLDGKLAVSRGFADFQFKNVDAPPDSNKLSCIPDIHTAILDSGDFVVLGCDGIFDFMGITTIVQKLQREVEANSTFDLGMFCVGLLQRVLELQMLSKGGFGDNMTLMVIRLGRSDCPPSEVSNEIYGVEKLERVAAKRLRNVWYAFLEYCAECGPLQPEVAQKAYLVGREQRRKDRFLALQDRGLGALHRCRSSDKAEAANLFRKILEDLSVHPELDSRVRRVKLTGARMQKVVSAAPGVECILLAVGYVREAGELVLPACVLPDQASNAARNMHQRLESEFPATEATQAGYPVNAQ